MKRSLVVLVALLLVGGCANMSKPRDSSASYGATQQMAAAPWCPYQDRTTCGMEYLP